MEDAVIAIVFFITTSLTIFGVMYFYFTTRNRERMALIEKNADPSIFYSKPGRGNGKTFVIKLGMLFIGGGTGTLFGNILAETTNLHPGAAFVSMIFLFAGAGLVASYFICKKTQQEK